MYYQWESPNYVFYALVSCDNKRNWTVHIGSKARPVCITLNVYKDEPEAILQNLSFDSTCASNKPMPRGIGTREMLNSAIFFIAKRFKWVERISFTDVSSFRCESKTIPISEMSFLLHQKTWYERHFNAMPKAVHLYESLREAYHSTRWTTSEWPLLWDKYFSRFELPEDALYELFQSYPKATDFFIELYKTYGCLPIGLSIPKLLTRRYITIGRKFMDDFDSRHLTFLVFTRSHK